MSETFVPFSKTVDEKQVVYGEVYVPDVIDSQGDYMNAEEIEKMAWRFMREGRVSKVDTNHDLQDNGSIVVESFIARPNDPDFVPGSWVVGVHIPDESLWRMVKSGELNGYSMYGMGQRRSQWVELDLPDDRILKGDTGETAGHTHRYSLLFDDKGNIIGGETDTVNGHSHKILKGTATEEAQNHRHRFSIMEAFRS